MIEIGSEISVVGKRTIRVNKQRVVEAIDKIKPQYLYNPAEMLAVFDESIKEASFVVKNKKSVVDGRNKSSIQNEKKSTIKDPKP